MAVQGGRKGKTTTEVVSITVARRLIGPKPRAMIPPERGGWQAFIGNQWSGGRRAAGGGRREEGGGGRLSIDRSGWKMKLTFRKKETSVAARQLAT